MGEVLPSDQEAKGGFVPNLLGLYTGPGEAFRSIVARPQIVAPLILMVALSLLFTGVWMSKMDPTEFMRAQIEQSPRADQIPADRMDEIISMQSKVMKYFAWGGAVLGGPITVVVLGGLFLLIYRFVYGADVRFMQSMAIVAFSFVAVSLVTTPLLLATFALKGDWNLRPDEVLQANLSLVVEKAATAKPLFALLQSLDLFTFWTIGLLCIGYGVACRKSTGVVAAGVLIPWAIVVLIKVGWAAIF
jgi:hypothetical protein